MIRQLIIVEGKVQGVGFRYFVAGLSTKHKITGTVRNMDNGMVEIYAQGEEDNLSNFLIAVRAGNRFVKVDDFSVKQVDLVQNEKGFKVKY